MPGWQDRRADRNLQRSLIAGKGMTPMPTDRYGRSLLPRFRKYTSTSPMRLCCELPLVSWNAALPPGENVAEVSVSAFRFQT